MRAQHVERIRGNQVLYANPGGFPILFAKLDQTSQQLADTYRLGLSLFRGSKRNQTRDYGGSLASLGRNRRYIPFRGFQDGAVGELFYGDERGLQFINNAGDQPAHRSQ